MLSVVLAATISSAAPQWIRDGYQPPIADAVRKLELCGFDFVETAFDEDTQEDVLRLRAGIEAVDERLACAAKVSFDTGYFIIVPQSLTAAYWRDYTEVSSAWSVELARKWLAENALLAGLPQFSSSGLTDEEFAKLLEERCGPFAEGLLSSRFGPHAIYSEHMPEDQTAWQKFGEAGICLVNSGIAAGFEIGLIGNEKVSEPD